jgi:(1->4)-alpha-D-glucan 1-alpha-D-glucosylmutase
LIKAVREAKVNSSWESPNERYENGCTEFIKNILKKDSAFIPSAAQFIKKLFGYASTNALGQVLIKVTAPGIPDVYQGCELWDLSYVDPDNRRPVDYSLRQKYLMQIEQKEKEGFTVLRSFLAKHRELGVEKLFVTWKVLNLRRKHKELFKTGEYMALSVAPGEAVACAYARHYQKDWMLIIVPLAVAKEKEWTQESILIPANLTGMWINLFTHKPITVRENLFIRDVMDEFPLCLLTKTDN